MSLQLHTHTYVHTLFHILEFSAILSQNGRRRILHTFKSFACPAIDNFRYFESFTSTLPNEKDKVKWELDFWKYFSFFTSFCLYVCACPSFLQKIKGHIEILSPGGSSSRKAARGNIYVEGRTDRIYHRARHGERRGKGRTRNDSGHSVSMGCMVVPFTGLWGENQMFCFGC